MSPEEVKDLMSAWKHLLAISINDVSSGVLFEYVYCIPLVLYCELSDLYEIRAEIVPQAALFVSAGGGTKNRRSPI